MGARNPRRKQSPAARRRTRETKARGTAEKRAREESPVGEGDVSHQRVASIIYQGLGRPRRRVHSLSHRTRDGPRVAAALLPSPAGLAHSSGS